MIKWWYLICVLLVVNGCTTSVALLPPLPSIVFPNLVLGELITTNKFKPSHFPVYTRLKCWNYTQNVMIVSNSYDLKTWYLYTNISPFTFTEILQTNKQEFFK